MPYEVINAVMTLVALIAAGIARLSINRVANLEHKIDDLMHEVSALRADLAARREKKKRGE